MYVQCVFEGFCVIFEKTCDSMMTPYSVYIRDPHILKRSALSHGAFLLTFGLPMAYLASHDNKYANA